MTLKTCAIVFGAVLIVVGILGFIPAVAPNGLLFNLFMVDTPHNIIHLLSGALAILSAINVRYVILYFKIFGVIYGIIGVLGFFTSDLLIIHVNTADNFLHLAIAAISIYLGFFYQQAPRLSRREPR